MNKFGKGASLLVGILLAVVVFGGVFTYFGWKSTQQSIVGAEPATVTAVAEQTAAGLKVGDAATVKFRAYDQESASTAQVAATLYVEEWNGEGVGTGDFSLIESGTAMSATAATSTPTTVGTNLRASVFDGSYYGDVMDFKVTKETQPVNLKAYRFINYSLKVDCSEDGAIESVCNMTLGTGQTNTFDYVRIEVNGSDRAYNFKELSFDTASASANITDIDITGSLQFEGVTASGSLAETSVLPQRLKNTVNYMFVAPQAIMLHEWDVIKTSNLVFTADAANNPYGETVTMYVMDESKFKSVASATQNKILSGIEDDAASENDVGAVDTTVAIWFE